MIEIFPFFPLFFGKPEEQNLAINIKIENRSIKEIIYQIEGINESTLTGNAEVELTTLNQDSKLHIAVREGTLVNVEISGENTNETHLEMGSEVNIYVTEDLTITITDFVPEEGAE